MGRSATELAVADRPIADGKFDPFIFAIVRFLGQASLAAVGLPGAMLAYIGSIILLFVAAFLWLLDKMPKRLVMVRWHRSYHRSGL